MENLGQVLEQNGLTEKSKATAAGKPGKRPPGETLEDRDYKNQDVTCDILCQGLETCPNHTNGWKRLLDTETTKEYGYNYYRYYKCPKLKAKEQNQTMERVIGEGYREASFKTCIADNDNREAVEKCRIYASGLTRYAKSGLILCGPVGTGKTFLAVVVLREAVKRGLHSAFVYVPDLINETKQEMRTGVNLLAGKAMNAYFLVLDDLGAEYDANWVLEALRRIIDHRSRHQKPTVVTANLRAEDLEMIDERIYSRLRGMCERVVVAGRDRRAERKAS